ncbi:3TM-type holin [Mesorhizobium australicum]|uniref:Holin of 3TMs, for gene-transfer release n=1 Tax=Mesorhizobium australicum TaxID=536018 RepID=A0A1X7NY65_9HYPH|nr:3TM-type holin [Mesorhizobium australicum]SMH42273.1 Holin of 3TMs, for gene-transfer release [Mesorhizobium australicum]
MTGLETILIGVATKIGAPLVKKVLQDRVGGKAGEVGGAIIDAIAGKAEVSAPELPDVPQKKLEEAVRAVEAEAPEIIAAYVEQQREQNRLQLAEMETGETWTWAWRPAGMWTFNVLIVWYVALVPVVNLVLQLCGATASLVLIVDVGTFFSLYLTFTSFYMGGHTAKDFFGKAADVIKTWKAGK